MIWEKERKRIFNHNGEKGEEGNRKNTHIARNPGGVVPGLAAGSLPRRAFRLF
jgi:hypothetical protein